MTYAFFGSLCWYMNRVVGIARLSSGRDLIGILCTICNRGYDTGHMLQCAKACALGHEHLGMQRMTLLKSGGSECMLQYMQKYMLHIACCIVIAFGGWQELFSDGRVPVPHVI